MSLGVSEIVPQVGNQLAYNTETVIIGYLSYLPPVYGIAHAFDGGETVGWGPTFNSRSDLVPVPSPEPTTILLLTMGLGVVATWRRVNRR